MKNPSLTLFLLCFFLTIQGLQAQDLDWAVAMGGTGADEGIATAVDDQGNIYTTGVFTGTIDLDPGPGTASHTSAGSRDFFIQKLDHQGNFVWAHSIGGTAFDRAFSIVLDGAGHLYLTGSFGSTVDFDPGPGTSTLTASLTEAYVLKMDVNGGFSWVKPLAGVGSEGGYDMDIDGFGNLYTTGFFNASVDFDPDTGTAILTSNGNHDVFVQKMDSTGKFLWARNMGGTGQDLGYSLAVDDIGNVYTTGRFGSIGADFDPGVDTFSLSTVGSDDIFIQKMDPNGNFLWAKRMGGSQADYGHALDLDSAGNVYTTGFFRTTVDFDPGVDTVDFTVFGQADVFVQKLNSNGDYQWARQIGGTQTGMGMDIHVDEAGNAYTIGWFYGSMDFDPGSGTLNLGSVGQSDIFVQKLDPSGILEWVAKIGGSSVDEGLGIHVDQAGNVYSTGFFEANVDFDPGTGISILSEIGNGDAFVQKLSQCLPSTATDMIIACDSFTWIDGMTYSASTDSAMFTLLNSAGCDSIITLDLLINQSSSRTDSIVSCGPYTWIDGVTYSSSNNSATFTLINSMDCDSIITLNLTVNQPSSGVDSIFSCGPYTWIDGITYTSSNDTASFLLSNSAGCDSLVMLHLVVDSVSDISTSLNGDTLFANNANATYQWLDCDNNFAIIPGETGASFIPVSSGSYAVELRENNCVDTSSCIQVVLAGRANHLTDAPINIYPNPASQQLIISGNWTQAIFISVQDSYGREFGLESRKAGEKVVVNTSQLPPGLYILHIRDGQSQHTEKVLIE